MTERSRDEAMDERIRKSGYYAEDPNGEVADMLRAVFCAGMLRAAEICEDWEYGETCARKIREEANAKS